RATSLTTTYCQPTRNFACLKRYRWLTHGIISKIGTSRLNCWSNNAAICVLLSLNRVGGGGFPAAGPGSTFGSITASGKATLNWPRLGEETPRDSMSAITPNFDWPQSLNLSPPRSYRRPRTGPIRLFVTEELTMVVYGSVMT